MFFKCGQNIVPVFPVYYNRIAYYPIVAGYSSTIHKVMGQTLPHVNPSFQLLLFESSCRICSIIKANIIYIMVNSTEMFLIC